LEQNQVRAIARLLELLYYSGCRINELCGLTWRSVKPNKESGQVTLFGKGGKTRAVLLLKRIYQVRSDLRGNVSDNAWSSCHAKEALFRRFRSIES